MTEPEQPPKGRHWPRFALVAILLALVGLVLWFIVHSTQPHQPTVGAPSIAPVPSSTRPGTGEATLGAPEATFVQRLGQPNDHSKASLRTFGRCPGSAVDQLTVALANGKAVLIQHQVCGTSIPLVADRVAEAMTFAPADAVVGDTFRTENNEPATRYRSATLSTLLDPTWFRDCNRNLLEPGTFSLIVTSTGWILAPGAC